MGSLALRPDDSLAILTMASSIGFRNSVSFLSAIQATGLLTFAPVGLPPTEHASLCWTHPKPAEQKKREDFRRFLDQVVAELPADKDIHVILDNYSTHKKNSDWLEKYDGRGQFHFTPTSASWLNQIEIWFSLLTRKALRGANFANKDELRAAIEAFVARTNQHPKPFHWRKREVKGSQLRTTIINLCN